MSRSTRFSARKAAAISAIAAMAVLLSVPVPANAESSQSAPDYLVEWQGEVPAELMSPEPLPEEFRTVGNADEKVLAALTQLQYEHKELGIAGTEWVGDRGVTLLYATADASEVTAIIRDYGLAGAVEYREAAFSAEEMTEQIRKITGDDGVLPSGQAVVMAVPALDGRSIDLTLDKAGESSRAQVEIPDVGLEVRVDYGEPVTPALRNHAPSGTNQRYSGALMHASNGCTTGFRGVRVSDSRPSMISADHCQVGGGGTGVSWYYGGGSSYGLGVAQGTLVPPTGRPDAAVWSGTGVYEMVPGLLVGGNTLGSSTLYPIKGAVTTSVGSTVCYSGAYSGTVCANQVTATGVTICYVAPYGCYTNLTLTTNTNSTPAAGNGDSGGPVYISSGSNAYAAGFISGIQNATTTCTGDPGSTNGRQCSDKVIYAPIIDMFDAGYAISIIP